MLDTKSPVERPRDEGSKLDRNLVEEACDKKRDTRLPNSSISVYPAKRRRIPIFHYEAGNRCFDERVPEEINRKIVDHVSDINLTYSEISKQYLISEGKDKDKVINIGSPMFEVINHYREKISKSLICFRSKLIDNSRWPIRASFFSWAVSGRLRVSSYVSKFIV